MCVHKDKQDVGVYIIGCATVVLTCACVNGNVILNPPHTLIQVCNISWSRNVNEIVSTHGYSQNQIIVWKYPSMSKLATLTGGDDYRGFRVACVCGGGAHVF